MNHWFCRVAVLAILLSSVGSNGYGQLLATDDFESYAVNPVGASGGTGSWIGNWGASSQFGGGTFLSPDSKITGAKTLGMYGNGSTAGTSVSRPFPACTNQLTISASMRGDFNANSTNAPNPRRMAFTIRSGNDSSHFGNQRLSFFFAAGSTNFQWYDGTDRITSAVNFTLGHVYDLSTLLNPSNRSYSFTVSNRNNGTSFSYAGNWSLGSNGESIGSVAFFMRGPTGAGNDAFLDNVVVSAPDYVAPPLSGPTIVEGALWRYFKGTSTPAAQGTNFWYNINYDDLSWSGPSPSGFGYGDCDDNTVLGDMQNVYGSIFTRKTFLVETPVGITYLTLAADYDDAFVAYINGTEVARRNLPAGPITHTNLALGAANHESSRGEGASFPPTEEKEFIQISPSVLVSGTNVIAVSGHNASLSSSDFSLIIELYTNAALVRGPFIQLPDAGNKATVVWRTSSLVDGAVDYGLDLSYSSGTVSNGTLEREHVISLPNLLPGTTYYYRVRSAGQILREGEKFVSRAATNQSFRFVVIGDFGQGTEWMYNIADRINARVDFDMMISVGDNVYGITTCNTDGAPGWYDPFWFQLYGQTMKRVATFPVLGNHDNDTATGKWTVVNFHLPTNGPPSELEKNFSFTFGNVHFSVIDSDPFQDNVSSKMAAITSWLSNDLAQATQPWRMALYHHPAYTSVGSHDDNVRVKQFVTPILKANGVQMVFQGHNHFYERLNAIDGINYLTSGACGAFLYSVGTVKPYSAKLYADRHSYTVVDVNGTRMKIQQFDENDGLLDEFQYEINQAFNIDGLLDNPSWLRASNPGGLKVYAAVSGYKLYVATQDAGEGNDHFVYLADNLRTQRAANWAKSGTIMQWDAFLADENDGAFNGWFGNNQQALTDYELYKSMSSGLNNNDPAGNGVLEGSIDLAAHFGYFPQVMYVAGGPYGNADGGALTASAQVPTGNGDGDIQSNEFFALNLRDIALDLPLADAGSNQSVEAGMWAVMSGAGSSSPAGLPLAYAWEKTSGPAVSTANLDQLMAAFVAVSNVAVNTDVTFRLRVNDGRFDSDDDFVTITLVPMVDSDGDGLSDFEELTGFDNTLTGINPAGNMTNPNLADTDGDGVLDGEEALSGTNPGNSNSVFKVVSASLVSAPVISLDWNTVTGRIYHVQSSEEVLSGWSDFQTFLATSSVTRIFDTNALNVLHRYYRMTVEY